MGLKEFLIPKDKTKQKGRMFNLISIGFILLFFLAIITSGYITTNLLPFQLYITLIDLYILTIYVAPILSIIFSFLGYRKGDKILGAVALIIEVLIFIIFLFNLLYFSSFRN